MYMNAIFFLFHMINKVIVTIVTLIQANDYILLSCVRGKKSIRCVVKQVEAISGIICPNPE